MLAQYDQATRDHMIKHRIVRRRFDRIFKNDGADAAIKRKVFTMTRSERLRAVVKQAGGVTPLCKRIVRDGSSGDISEAELTGMITATAKAEYPHLTSEAAFSKMFCGPDGETLRRAMQVAMFTQLYGR
jgi:hypothetical protein